MRRNKPRPEEALLSKVLFPRRRAKAAPPVPILYCVLCVKPKRADGGGLCPNCRKNIDTLWEVVNDVET